MFLFFKSILIIVSIDEVKVGVSRLRKLWFIVRFVFLASVCRSSPESSSAEEDQPCSQEAKEDQTNSHPNPLGFPGKKDHLCCACDYRQAVYQVIAVQESVVSLLAWYASARSEATLSSSCRR